MSRFNTFSIRWAIGSRLAAVHKHKPKRPLIAGLAAIFFLFAMYVEYLDLYITERFEGRHLPAWGLIPSWVPI